MCRKCTECTEKNYARGSYIINIYMLVFTILTFFIATGAIAIIANQVNFGPTVLNGRDFSRLTTHFFEPNHGFSTLSEPELKTLIELRDKKEYFSAAIYLNRVVIESSSERVGVIERANAHYVKALLYARNKQYHLSAENFYNAFELYTTRVRNTTEIRNCVVGLKRIYEKVGIYPDLATGAMNKLLDENASGKEGLPEEESSKMDSVLFNELRKWQYD